ncbi:MAG TPA: hypothetical protein VMU87_16305 [Stellaceae bacterium]|nr:hypothetical protein [Stellaceae bacterium]
MSGAVVTPTIISAVANPGIWRCWFRDFDTWRPWLVFLKTLFGLPMDDAELALFRECTGLQEPPAGGVFEAWLVCGRRAGKSFILALVAVYLAVFRDWSAFLSPGEIGTIKIIATDRRQARTIFRYCRALIAEVSALAPMIVRETDDEIILSTAIVIEIQTASYRSVRGYTLIAILCDELAFWRTSGDSAVPDTEILAALRPAMATVKGAMLLCASSPFARRGELWETYRRHFATPGPVLVWQASTKLMNPTVPDDVIAEAYERDPASASAEYGARFRDDVQSFLSYDLIERAAVIDAGGLPPSRGVEYACGIDTSAGRRDAMAMAIAHRTTAGRIVVDLVYGRKPPFDSAETFEEFTEIALRYGVHTVHIDSFAAELFVSAAPSHGIRAAVVQTPKSTMYLEAEHPFAQGTIDIPRHPVLMSELRDLERRTHRGSKDSIDHPSGENFHDDHANAMALAIWAAVTESAPSIIPAASIRIDAADQPMGFVDSVLGVMWITTDGTVGYSVAAHVIDGNRLGSLVIAAFDERPWTSVVPETVAATIDQVAERARETNVRSANNGVSCLLYVPSQFHAVCHAAMGVAFQPRLTRIDARLRVIDCCVIDASYLRAPTDIILQAGALVSQNLVRITHEANTATGRSPMWSALSAMPGERLFADPLRVALVLSVVLGLGREPDSGAPNLGMAKLVRA